MERSTGAGVNARDVEYASRVPPFSFTAAFRKPPKPPHRDLQSFPSSG